MGAGDARVRLDVAPLSADIGATTESGDFLKHVARRHAMSGHRWVVGILVMGLLLTGCAKRPAMTGASAPAPGGGTAAAEPAKPAPATAGPVAQGARPAPPSEFAENSALKDIHFDFDKSVIRPDDAKILDTSATWLKANSGQLI